MAYNYPTNEGSFVQTTNVWDVSEITSVDVNSPEFKELLVRLYQNINLIALNLNSRDAGYYTTAEFVNGQLWFPNPANNSSTGTYPENRQVFRKVINFGALPNTGTKTVAHNIPITAGYTFTRIYGTSSDTSGFNYIPLPYAGGSNIQLKVDGTNVTVITTSDRTNFNVTYIILEYIKS